MHENRGVPHRSVQRIALLFLITRNMEKLSLTNGVLPQAAVPATNDVDNDDGEAGWNVQRENCSLRTTESGDEKVSQATE